MSRPRQNSSKIATVFRPRSLDFATVCALFLAKIYPSRCPCVSGFRLAYFSFFFLFSVFLSLLSTPQKCPVWISAKVSKFYYCGGFCRPSISFRFSPRFSAKIYPSRCLFFRPLFALFFVFLAILFGYFGFFFLLLVPPIFRLFLVPLKIRSIRNSQGDVAPPPHKATL